jgi:hypothetical protein
MRSRMMLSVGAMGGDCRVCTSVVFISVGDTCIADPYLWFLERDKVSCPPGANEVGSYLNNGHEVRGSDVTESRSAHSLLRITYASHFPEIIVNSHHASAQNFTPSDFDKPRGPARYGGSSRNGGTSCNTSHEALCGSLFRQPYARETANNLNSGKRGCQ